MTMRKQTAALAGGVVVALGSVTANALEVGLELNWLAPANQDVVLGSDYSDTGANDILDPDTDIGFKLFVQGDSWRASWLSLSSKSDFARSADGSERYTALDHPDDDYGSYDEARANGRIDLDELAVDYLIPLTSSDTTKLALTAGLRYVMFESKLDVNYDDGGQELSRKADNDLFGLRAGIEGSRAVGPVSIEAAFGLGLLFGDSNFTQTESSGDFRRELSWSTLSPTIDAQVRVAYGFLESAKVWLGYELLQYMDVATQQIYFDDVAEGANFQKGIDAGFHGFKVGFSWDF